jgi:PAS domain S-box-containing protein
MSIRSKILFVLEISVCIFVLLNIGIAYQFILPSFKNIELDLAKTNVERVQGALNNDKLSLGSKLSDWSNWDDTYEFIIDKNKNYIEQNLPDVSFSSLKIDFIFFVDKTGEVVFEKGYDFRKNHSIENLTGWKKYLQTNGVLTDFNENKIKDGLIVVDEVPIIFASHPILTSNADGESRGTLIFAKYLDDGEIEEISKTTKLNVVLKNVNNFSEEAGEGDLTYLASGGDQIKVKEVDGKNIKGYFLINDIYNNPAVILSVDLKREIFYKGLSAVTYFAVFSVAIGLAILIIMGQLLEFLVMRKIIRFNSSISEIAKSRNFSKKIDIKGNDEFSNMSNNTNLMLEALKNATYDIETEHQKSKAYLEVMGTMVVALDIEGKTNFINQKTRNVLNLDDSDEIVNKDWFDLFVSKEDKAGARLAFEKMIKGEEETNYHENFVVSKNGESRKLIAWHNSVLKDGLGKIIGTVSSGEDITEKKKREEVEQKQAKELKKTNELMMGREMKIVELKKEIKELKEKLGEL